jgi:hypothetical protein
MVRSRASRILPEKAGKAAYAPSTSLREVRRRVSVEAEPGLIYAGTSMELES